MEGAVAHESTPAMAGNSPPPFLSKTYDMVDDPSTDSVVSWSKNNNSFVVWSVPDFSRDVLPKFFKHNNFSSFVRQLSTYGFRKVDPDRFEFANECFLRGHKHLLKSITRRKATHIQNQLQPSPVPNASVGSCVEVGKFGLEEDIERLKRDKNVLMQELVRLRQQQQLTDNQLLTVGQRVRIMEQQQQQMMSFLAKAMQSPGFVSQLVHQPNEGNRRISGVNKKRRLHNPGVEDILGNQVILSPNRQVRKYHPLMNEAAKSVFHQILKINASGRLENKINHTNGFLTDKTHSSDNELDIGSPSSWGSGVIFSEVLSNASQPLSMESGILGESPSASISDIESPPSVVSPETSVSEIPELNALCSPDKATSCKFPNAQVSENGHNLRATNLKAFKIGDIMNKDTVPGLVEGTLPVVPDGVPSDPNGDHLPGINDVFWEQFLAESPLYGEIDDTSSMLSVNNVEDQDQLSEGGNQWDKIKHINHLTEQMGLLVAASKQV